MKTSLLLRLPLLVLSGAALPAHALDAYSNIPAAYSTQSYRVFENQTIGFAFTSGATGRLTGFTAAMNNFTGTGTTPMPFTFSLYANDSGAVGSLLGAYPRFSTGVPVGTATTALTTVAATGPAVNLTTGTTYWLVATASNPVSWSLTNGTNTTQAGVYAYPPGGTFAYANLYQSAFSVQAVPEPSALAALALGAATMLRRRRRA